MRSQSPSLRVALVIGAAMIVASVEGCRTPTQATVEIVSEIAHRSDVVVTVQMDAEDRVETAAPRIVTRQAWGADGVVGTVAALPNDGDVFVARVVLAIGREPASCSPADARGCVVARRRVRFVAGEETRARVVLRPACLGVLCDAASTCGRDGTCGPIDSDEGGVGGGDAGASPVTTDAGDPYAAAIFADRPRHYYRLDEPSGSTVAKDAMGRADGTFDRVKLGVTGALATSANTGAYFDGLVSALVVERPEDLPGAASFEAWVRSDAGEATAPPTILERVDLLDEGSFGYRLSKPIGSIAAFEIFRGATTARALVQTNRFAGYTHIVAVTHGGAITIYVGGSQAETTTFDDQPVIPVLSPLVIGASRAGAGAWRGTIDEVAIYDYPLDAEQVMRHRLAAGDKQ